MDHFSASRRLFRIAAAMAAALMFCMSLHAASKSRLEVWGAGYGPKAQALAGEIADAREVFGLAGVR